MEGPCSPDRGQHYSTCITSQCKCPPLTGTNPDLSNIINKIYSNMDTNPKLSDCVLLPITAPNNSNAKCPTIQVPIPPTRPSPTTKGTTLIMVSYHHIPNPMPLVFFIHNIKLITDSSRASQKKEEKKKTISPTPPSPNPSHPHNHSYIHQPVHHVCYTTPATTYPSSSPRPLASLTPAPACRCSPP